MLITVKNEKLTLVVDTHGAEMQSIRSSDGTEYLWQGDSAYWADRSPVLFPFIGRLTNNQCKVDGVTYPMGLHGFAHACEFACTEQAEDKVTLTLKSNEETKKQYPFDFVLSVTYALEDHKIVVIHKVENCSDRTMPFALGGHPGFNVPLAEGESFEDYYLEFSKACLPDRIFFTPTVYLNGITKPYPMRNDRIIDLKHNLFDDDAIILQNVDREVTLRSRKSNRAVKVSYPDLAYIGFWHLPKSDAPFVCIEPWSSLPSRQDVVEELTCRSDMFQLPAGKVHENTWTITVF